MDSQASELEEMGLLPELGEYHVLGLDKARPVAVSTLADPELADQIAGLKPEGLSIIGKTETENIGIEKIIKNILAVPSIRCLILCGRESMGHFSGSTMLALFKNGFDGKLKVIDAKGKKPILANTAKEQIEAFRHQIEVVDMIGCQDKAKILEKIGELAMKACSEDSGKIRDAAEAGQAWDRPVELIQAPEKDPYGVKLDKGGYFVIVPKAEQHIILVEHYSNGNKLLRIIRGTSARDIYWTILDNKWLTEMSHAAYLGKELTRAELSMELGFKFVQDKA